MRTTFVGRTRELRGLTRYLEEGRSVVLTGVFGSGRTTFVRHCADEARHRRFVFWKDSDSQRAIRVAIDEAIASTDGNDSSTHDIPPVVVVDDVGRVTASRLRFFRELVRARGCQFIVIIERSMLHEEVGRLRVALGAARLIRLGPLGARAAERYFSVAALNYRLGWSGDEIRAIARSTHGHPLTMRVTLEGAVVPSRLGTGENIWNGRQGPSVSTRETLARRWSPPLTVWRRARLMTPAEPIRQELCQEAIMTTLCPACWRIVPNDARVCSHCGADISQLHERDFRDKLLGALSHPDRDTVIRAAVALAARHDPLASHAIETAMTRFPNEPHVLAGLLNALMFVGDDDARRIAQDALGHRSFIVRRAAAQALQHLDPQSESACARREP